MNEINGIINVYKERGYTSHDVVAIIRKQLSRAKTGHTGTLDPEAEGVLPICIGKATKISEHLASEVKGYRAVVNLGTTTDTLDFTGTVLTEKPVNVSQEDIENVVASFVGEQLQTPPMYSAIKVNGQKLYDLARAGIEIERKQRQIQIFEISIVDFLSESQFVIDVLCSKGTYIRSLCFDIGEKLGCGANMGKLLRTRSGQFVVEDSVPLEKIKAIIEAGKLDEILLPIDHVLSDYKKVFVSSAGDKYLYNGNKISSSFFEEQSSQLEKSEKVLVYDTHQKLVGIYVVILEKDTLFLKPETMLL